MQLDGRHHYIIEIVAETFGLDRNEVEDNLLDGTQVISVVCSDSFFVI